MQISKRDFLKRLGIGGAAAITGAAFGDEYVASNEKLPPGAIGDPMNPRFGKWIYPIDHTVEDGPSSFMKGGKVMMPGREVPIFHETDVVVVGGGCAGFAAAVAAAKTGAKVALVEKDGSLGGLFTNGMVLIVLATARKEAGGDFTVVTRGVCGEFMDRALNLGSAFCTKPTKDNLMQPTVDPEGAKYLMDRMVEEQKIDMFFHAWGIDVIQEGNKIRGIVFMSKQGMQAILAKTVVDCTGDGDIYFAAGAQYRQITHGIGFVSRWANLDRITAKRPPRDKDGNVLPGYWIMKGNEGNPSTCWTGVPNHHGDGLDIRNLTREEIYHRKETWEGVQKLRKTPGWEEVFIANTCSQIGPRVTRLLKSECIVDRAMIANNWDPEDAVGWFGVDGPHSAWKVPYRSLLPVGVDNLLSAGRCIGAPDTCDTFRLIAPCFVTGEAAGTAAALAALSGKSPRDIDVKTLQKTLVKNGVYL